MIPFYIQLIFAGLFGLALGSFLNVCIYRIPENKSIIHPPSSCPSCGIKIRFYDNIPVISYIILLGRCRQCRESISIGYPLIEILTCLLSLALITRYNLNNNIYQYFIFLIFTSSLIVVSFIDLRHQIIPDIISIPGIFLGLIISFFFTHITWYDSLIGVILGGGILYLFAVIFELLVKKEAMGGGDIKLMAMIGAWMGGWKSILFIIMVSSLIGSILGTVSLLLSKKGIRSRIPFGPFLALGAIIYLFFGKELITWYFNIFSF